MHSVQYFFGIFWCIWLHDKGHNLKWSDGWACVFSELSHKNESYLSRVTLSRLNWRNSHSCDSCTVTHILMTQYCLSVEHGFLHDQIRQFSSLISPLYFLGSPKCGAKCSNLMDTISIALIAESIVCVFSYLSHKNESTLDRATLSWLTCRNIHSCNWSAATYISMTQHCLSIKYEFYCDKIVKLLLISTLSCLRCIL